eukprot:TRINITY_DN30737_c0_g1_i1.p1 TRINITY_DN30737_c0_g1~~TRINITY_DN30737_c0_g1_i1.p1  ORF type:complete len:311 (+),score=49.60 TRINITY_DN30737_c0_g1_i1:33-965(+)
MDGGVALWADSTYGCSTTARLLEIAREADFPLESVAVAYGAGLAQKGDCASYNAAPYVVVEMGYNDTASAGDIAQKKMQAQPWFLKLREGAQQVKLVTFVSQPSYKQCAGARRGAKKAKSQWKRGDVVQAGPLLETAVRLVRTELGLPVHILERPGEELFAGFCRDEEGALWQDEETCWSYTDHGVSYSSQGQPAMWEDSQHPSAAGAEEHLRRLIRVLEEELPAAIARGEDAFDRPATFAIAGAGMPTAPVQTPSGKLPRGSIQLSLQTAGVPALSGKLPRGSINLSLPKAGPQPKGSVALDRKRPLYP